MCIGLTMSSETTYVQFDICIHMYLCMYGLIYILIYMSMNVYRVNNEFGNYMSAIQRMYTYVCMRAWISLYFDIYVYQCILG